MNHKLQAVALVVCALALTVIVRGASIAIAPQNPTLLAGQTIKLTPGGAVVPGAIATGAGHTCVLYSDQTIRCTGQNSQGQVGNGTYTNVFEPALASGTVNPVTLHTGLEHTCTLVGDGRMQCWGTNYTGQLGDGTIGGFAMTPQFVHGMTNAVKAFTGGFFTCAIVTDSTVQCWGRNQDGQLGNGDSTTDVPLPAPVQGLGPVADFAGGGYHACAIMSDRTVKCWGRNVRGQVGDGTINTPVVQPHAVVGLSNVASLSLGTYHSCALLQDRTVQCWGQNDFGQIGAQGAVYSATPGRGERDYERRQHRRRIPPYLRAARRRHGAVLGSQRRRPAWRRDDHQFCDASDGAGRRQSARDLARHRTHLRPDAGRLGHLLG